MLIQSMSGKSFHLSDDEHNPTLLVSHRGHSGIALVSTLCVITDHSCLHGYSHSHEIQCKAVII